MNKEIVINGVNVMVMAAQQKAMQEGAAKFISDGVENVTRLVSQLSDAEDRNAAEALATEAHKILEQVHLVSEVSGVSYFVPYAEEYGDDESLSSVLDELELDFDTSYLKGFDELKRLLSEMERQSYLWYSSSAQCC